MATIKKQEVMVVEFTDDEIAKFDLREGDKFSLEMGDDGCISLVPYESIEIDLAEFPRDVLEFLIFKSIDDESTIEEVIEDILIDFLNERPVV